MPTGKRDSRTRGRRVKNHFHLLVAFLSAALMSILALPILAQTVTTSPDRAQLVQDQTQPQFGTGVTPEGIEDGHAVESPNDPDIGQQEILKRVTQYNPWVVALATPVFYTSNVALTNRGEKGDVVFAPAAAFFYEPQLAKTLYAHIGAREQVFYYGKYTTFDFASLDCEAGLTYFMPQFHNLVLRGWYDFNRLTLGGRLGDEFFSNHGIILNAELPFRIGRAQQFSVGADTNLSVGADHQSPRRNDYEGYLGYSVDLTRSFSLHAVGRVVARDYHQNGRTDVSEIISGTATYRLNNLLSISAISSFAHSDSNQDVFDYDVGNVGGVVEFSLRF
jgi:hypothetical protein